MLVDICAGEAHSCAVNYLDSHYKTSQWLEDKCSATRNIMSAEKRSASNSFGTSQLVKRQKSNADLGASSAVAVTNANVGNGALIQAVSYLLILRDFSMNVC